MVYEISAEVLGRPDVRTAGERMRLTRARSPGAEVERSDATDIPGLVGYLRTRADPSSVQMPDGRDKVLASGVQSWGKMDRYRMAQTGTLVKEQQKTGAINAITQGLGKGSYPEIAGLLRQTRLSDQRIASSMRAYLRTGKLPNLLSPADAALIERAAFLMTVRESTRNVANLGFGPMTLDLIGRREMTWDDALAKYQDGSRRGERGEFPMSMKKAVPASRGLEAEMLGGLAPDRGPHQKDRQELREREIALVDKWATTVMGPNGFVGENETAALSTARTKIKEFILKSYGLSNLP
jgi:hypothetical protein